MKINCPFHRDDTASLKRYGPRWYCFGACAKQYTNEEVSRSLGTVLEDAGEDFDEPEDLSERFRYIESLPKERVRGLDLPADERGFYVTWPGASYFKYRLFSPGKGSKYLGPKGHSPPLFWASKRGYSDLYIIEGEINALSVARAVSADVCSPGSAGCFKTAMLLKHLTEFKNYSNVFVVLDDDAAGLKGLIEAKAAFLYQIPFVRYLLIKPDCNDILVQEGEAALRERLQRANTR